MKSYILALILLATPAAFADYEDNFIGSCNVKNSELSAHFYVRNDDRHFRFDFIDTDGEIYTDRSAIHRQNIFAEYYGIKLKRNKVKIRANMSFFKAQFTYDTKKLTATFKHSRSCIADRPCRLYVEKYRVDFENCDLDFEAYLD